MIKYTTGNILKADSHAIVNTVNCVGVMGKGIALQFKKAFPENFKAYKKASDNKKVVVGSMFIFDAGSTFNPRFIINFPTKIHWREKSKYKFIEDGLKDLRIQIESYKIKSIAIPPLGCGLGGLEWSKVRLMIEWILGDLDIEIIVFEPKGAPSVKEQPIELEKKPRMTKGRALLIALIDIYKGNGYGHTALEMQKIMYFIKEAGEDIPNLKFDKAKFGPYSDGLRHAIQQLEGYYICGVGDGTQESQVNLVESALKDAKDFLSQQRDAQKYLEKVKQLIDGYETPYGMELLATVHFASKYQGAKNIDEAIKLIRGWNYRKSQLMKDRHIEKAWHRLENNGWLKAG